MPITVTMNLPANIEQGLATGAYERVGGVIREVGTKRVIMWLRDAGQTVVDTTSAILKVSIAADVLTLAITTAEFAVIMRRLDGLETGLRQIQQDLKKIKDNMDRNARAQFEGALKSARDALSMQNERENTLSNVAADLRTVQALYREDADSLLEQQHPRVLDSLLAFGLAYVAQARCHLELENIETARTTLAEGEQEFYSRANKLVHLLLTEQPCAYLHPSLSESVTLENLTRIYQWQQKPERDVNAVFESLRSALFRFDESKWAESLPKVVAETPFVNRKIKGRPVPKTRIFNPVVWKDMAQAFKQIETVKEAHERLQSYLVETETIKQNGLSFRDWQSLHGDTTQGYIYCLPEAA